MPILSPPSPAVTAEKRRPRIAVIARWLPAIGGTSNGIIERSRRLARAGWEVHIYAERLDHDALLAIGAIPHRILSLPSWSGLARRFFSWHSERAVSQGGFDLVVGHGDIQRQDVLVLHNCVEAAHEAVHGQPSGDPSELMWLHRRLLTDGRFRLLIANSRLMRADVMRRFGVPEEKIAVVYPGHDPSRFLPAGRPEDRKAVRGELDLHPEDVAAGLITSGDLPKRGVTLFLESLARAHRSRPRLAGVIVGKERRVGKYRSVARRLGIADRVRFVEPRADIERLYRALDLFFYPALFEEFGQTVQEAMACGLPVLTSRRVGAAELLGEESHEFVLPAPERDGFAAALCRLADDAPRREAWGRRCRHACRDNDWDLHFERVRALYERALRGGGTPI